MRTPRLLPAAAVTALAAAALLPSAASAQLLTGRAVLPADTFAGGPPSGARITGSTNGVPVPFAEQPVQGFSAVIPVAHGDKLALADNGYGALENSADFHLRIYRIDPDFRSFFWGSGDVRVKSYVELRDPDRKLPFTIVNEYTDDRVLTGADLDPESLQRDPGDGTLWIGEEFGPFLIHVDTTGKVLDAPVALPDADHPGTDVRAPQSPYSEESSPQRLMNALTARGKARGGTRTPVVSPDSTWIADGDPATNVDLRDPAAVSSEIFDVTKLHAAGFKVVPYTVNDPAQMDKLLKLGVDGLISDRSDLLHERLAAFDANGDGTPGDYLLPDGRVDPAKFDAQGHRGSRNLRPENTLPAMEAGLDNLVNTLETDNGITADGTPVLDHEPYVSSVRCRRADGAPYGVQDEELVKDLTLAQLQAKYTCDNVFRGASQSSEKALSPVAVAFAEAQGLRDPYVMPSTDELFAFVRFYADWFTTGPGRDDPQAATLAANARAVRFNIETKTNPRTDTDDHGKVFAERTIGPAAFADAVTGVIEANPDEAKRSFVQSFDFRTLLRVQDEHPDLQLVALWGDTPKGPGADEDGTNVESQPGTDRSAWLAGMQWPYRRTAVSTPFRAQASGGYEGMARAPFSRTLLPMLEKPLTGDPAGTTLILEFDLRTRSWTGRRWRYAFEAAGVSIGDFQLADRRTGLVLERDNGQGTTAQFKTVEQITLGRGDGHVVQKKPVLDELKIWDPAQISRYAPTTRPGDHLIGTTFGLPFQTIESLEILSRHHVLIGVDNNYPFSLGRHLGTGTPDDSEFVTVWLGKRIG